MNKGFIIISIIIFISAVFFMAPFGNHVSAQVKGVEYQMLEKTLPGFEDKGGLYTATSQNFSDFLNKAFKIGIIVAIVLSILMIVVGGIEYMGSDSLFKIEDAKKRWRDVAWGLLLALGIYLFLFTINPDLVKFNLEIPETKTPAAGTPTPGTPSAPTSLGRWTEARAQSVIESDNRVRNRLSSQSGGRVTVKSNACNMDLYKQWVTNGNANGSPNCTTVGELPDNTINKLIMLSRSAQGCNCSFEISGGTEWGHSSHFPGQGVVDIRWGSGVDAFVQRNKSVPGSPPFVRTYRGVVVGGANASFFEEDAGGKHWHVVL